jgi:hypothetical protein
MSWVFKLDLASINNSTNEVYPFWQAKWMANLLNLEHASTLAPWVSRRWAISTSPFIAFKWRHVWPAFGRFMINYHIVIDNLFCSRVKTSNLPNLCVLLKLPFLRRIWLKLNFFLWLHWKIFHSNSCPLCSKINLFLTISIILINRLNWIV